MAITIADIKIKRSLVVSDATGNGGLPGVTEILTGVRHALFPRVTPAERAAGITRYRKAFLHNQNSNEDVAYNVMVYPEYPSPAGDRFGIAAATTKGDTQADADEASVAWVGVGSLVANVSAGATSLQLAMESNDFAFPAGGILHISNKYRTSQTIAAGARAGDSVNYNAGTWEKISATNDITYPKGIYLGGTTVMSLEATSSEEWVSLHGSTPVSWSGNTATITLAEPLGNAYLAANTFGGAAIVLGDIKPTTSGLSKSSATGTYDNAAHPLQVFNRSTVDDTITVTFTSATAFTAAGATLGSLGGGTVSSPFTPVNGSSLPYFTIPAGFFGGTWAIGDTFTFSTASAQAPVWFREIVPAATAANSNNLLGWGWYAE